MIKLKKNSKSLRGRSSPIRDLSEVQEQLNQWIEECLPKATSNRHQKVIEAMDYSVRNGGKRIRPLLMYASYQLLVKQSYAEEYKEDLYPFLGAMEMIHTYSLIHDDLPAMDDDDLRRGKPTCHIVFGEANAILAGDGLLNYAFESISQKAYDTLLKYPERGIRMVRAMATLSKAAGIYGMIGGQAADMLFENSESVALEDLLYIHRHKTGALLEASCVIGAILSGASEGQIELLRNIGENIGLAFQIQDDLLDRLSTTEELGKPVHSDEKNKKTTYLSFYSIEEAKVEILRRMDESLCLAKELGHNEQAASLLNSILEYIKYRKC